MALVEIFDNLAALVQDVVPDVLGGDERSKAPVNCECNFQIVFARLVGMNFLCSEVERRSLYFHFLFPFFGCFSCFDMLFLRANFIGNPQRENKSVRLFPQVS